MLSYLGDPELKASTLAVIAAHRAADEIAKGAYVRAGLHPTYCAVGCVLKDPHGGHARYETEFGIPAQLAHLEDAIFETLPLSHVPDWPGRFMSAIPVGADLSSVWPRYAVWLMMDPKWGLVNTTKAEDVKAVCLRVADAYARIADGGTLTTAEEKDITEDARDAWDAWDAWAAWDAFAIASADKLVEILESVA